MVDGDGVLTMRLEMVRRRREEDMRSWIVEDGLLVVRRLALTSRALEGGILK